MIFNFRVSLFLPKFALPFTYTLMKNTATHTRLFVLCAILFLAILGFFLTRQQVAKSRHYALLLNEAQWMNQHDSLFTTDSVMLRVARHYDHWWHSRNRRMKAYYLLGCAYRDMGEAPAAIHYYNIATEQADTTAKDCDFATLFRVYGQMAVIYGQQSMPMEKKEALKHYGHFAWLAHDTLNHIIAYEHMASVCYLMDDTMGVYAYTDSAHVLYKEHGYMQQAAMVYPTAIYVRLQNKNYMQARHDMDIFERDSKLFDDEGNIQEGRELYYYSRGLYYAGIHQLDTAEYWFRRLIPHGYIYEANDGLLSVFQQRGNTDSIVKYSALTNSTLLELTTQRQADAVIQSSAMYKYERIQNISIRNAQRAARFKLLCLLLSLLAIFIISIVYRYFHKRSLAQETQLHELDRQYMNAREEHRQLMEEYQILKNNYNKTEISEETQKLIEKKQSRIAQLEEELQKFQSNLNLLKYAEREKLLMKNEIVTFFVGKTRIVPNWKPPREEKWRALSEVYSQYMPLVTAHMKKAGLSKQEWFVTILTHLNFMPGDIAKLLDTGGSRISNAKRDASRKLFGDEESARLRNRLINIECDDKLKDIAIN